MNFTRFLQKRNKTLTQWVLEEGLTNATLAAATAKVVELGSAVDPLSPEEVAALVAALPAPKKPAEAPVEVIEVVGEVVEVDVVAGEESVTETPPEPSKGRHNQRPKTPPGKGV